MILKTLFLSNFRNIDSVNIDFVDGTNVFIGQNGQGKTNILEATYFLLKGTSFRATKLSEVIKEEQDQAKVSGVVFSQTKQKIDLTVANKTLIQINDKRVFSRTLRERYPLVLFEPESLLAIKKGPELRRELLDEVMVINNSNNVVLLSDYKKALRLRNQILKNAKEKLITIQKAKALLECSNDSFLDHASLVSLKRRDALESISSDVKKLFYDITKKHNLKLNYMSNKINVLDKDQEFLRRLISSQQDFEKEVVYGYSLSGPHTDDLDFVVGKRRAKTYLSQGEQRALILAIKAALVYHCVSIGKKPLLLLDDVFSELDVRKREFLAHILQEAKSQTIITMTEREKAMEFEKFFLVTNGRIDKI